MLEFLEKRLSLYSEQRNEPELFVASGLSPFLHFGHLSVHEIFPELIQREKWQPKKLSLRTNGSREGWWNMSAAAESFLDELITWREVGYNFSSHRDNYDKYESLPDWVRNTLKEHARDERDHVYTLEQFEYAKTHDPLWNAAQTQLVREGRIHNYLRMLWGKKILQWSRSPQEAARIMIHLNNKYGLDESHPESLQRHLLGARPIRPSMGACTAGIRNDSLYEFGKHSTQGIGEKLHSKIQPGIRTTKVISFLMVLSNRGLLYAAAGRVSQAC